jgi:hypothetical protein
VMTPAATPALRVEVAYREDLPEVTAIFVTDGAGFGRVVGVARSEPSDVDVPGSGTYKIFGIDRSGGIHSGPKVTVEGGISPVRLSPRATARVALRFTSVLPGPLAVTSDGYSITPVLGFSGVALSALPGGSVRLPPLSHGRWKAAVGDAEVSFEPEKDEQVEVGGSS